MSAPVFVLAAADAGAAVGARVRLGGAEGRHASVVRRLGIGEEVGLTDGAGVLLACVVVAADREGLTLEVRRRVDLPVAEPRVVVVQALAKGDRGELAVELLTEVGADEVVPWAAARAVVQWRGERGERSRERWASTAHEAAKQSRRARFPVVAPLASTREVADRLRAAALPLVLHEDAVDPLPGVALPDAGEVVLVVGPEGGVAPEELAAFTAAGALAVRLGPTVLRTSTAGAVAAALVLSRTSRWAAPVLP